MSSGDIIATHRKRIGQTQEQLAESIHVSRQTLAIWETSRQFPSDSVAILAARFLKLNEAELMEQLRWDRLHQRVDQLEARYNATIAATHIAHELHPFCSFCFLNCANCVMRIQRNFLSLSRLVERVLCLEAPSSRGLRFDVRRLPTEHTRDW